jgi:hypothetical protein
MRIFAEVGLQHFPFVPQTLESFPVHALWTTREWFVQVGNAVQTKSQLQCLEIPATFGAATL